MKFSISILLLLVQFAISVVEAKSRDFTVNYVKSIENQNHPQIGYWLFNKEMLVGQKYRQVIDTIAQKSKFDLLFLTAQGKGQVNLFDDKTMHPILKDMVEYGQKKGVRIGLQLFPNKSPEKGTEENCVRMVQEGEVILSDNGTAEYSVEANYIRNPSLLNKSEVLKIFAFKKSAEGVYDPATLREITQYVKGAESKTKLSITINAGKELSGYTAYILSQHFYRYSACESSEDSFKLRKIVTAYSDIPLAGLALDEYCNLDILNRLKKDEVYRGRRYSEPMAAQFKSRTGKELVQTLFEMRYAPQGKPEVRMSAINQYMEQMCSNTLRTQSAMYDMGKSVFGPNTFIGCHNTRHNALNNDEVWQTGLAWWNIKRDYGHSDEHTPFPTKMGIGMSYAQNSMYNMYYTRNLKEFVEQSLTDLRYGFRTNYLGVASSLFGLRVDSTGALNSINKVESFARLFNHFNPSFPKIKLLVLFGMPEQLNWFPDEKKRNKFDISNIEVERIAKMSWDKGYLNALLPTNVIDDGRLTLNKEGKPCIMGHTFDAILFLYPQYSKKGTLTFLKNYVDQGGKLMLEGDATHDFDSKNIAAEWEQIKSKATEKSFSLEKIGNLGITPNAINDGVENEDGSYTFTNKAVFESNEPSEFNFTIAGNNFKGKYKGGAAIKIDKNGNLEKLAATGFSTLTKNDKPCFSLSKAADVLYEIKDGKVIVTIVDETKKIKVVGH